MSDMSNILRFESDAKLIEKNASVAASRTAIALESPEEERDRLGRLNEVAGQFYKDNMTARLPAPSASSRLAEERARVRQNMEMLIKNQHPPKELPYWLQLDSWTADQGLPVLCGYCQDFDCDEGFEGSYIRLDGLRLFDDAAMGFLDGSELLRIRREFTGRHRRMVVQWESGRRDDGPLPPGTFIEWALKKGIEIPWLEWAQENGCYRAKPIVSGKSDSDRADSDLNPKERGTFSVIIAALCSEAGVDYSSREATSEIGRLVNGIGHSLHPDTIRPILKGIPSILSARVR
ncbi:hypothetical protein [Janthinobacterium aquaticum]|uniref:hypothetical protein n=1 Tax=Janthinobacterium sp. FT58W TaxID=2654254 RepID=UPI00126464A8|nr:hypothetical protein [Janthinobacterium sp. FT58W]KAB8042577.1 hypothetical protein GCM43_13725 [Janthinobacterium sp. FT58W]